MYVEEQPKMNNLAGNGMAKGIYGYGNCHFLNIKTYKHNFKYAVDDDVVEETEAYEKRRKEKGEYYRKSG